MNFHQVGRRLRKGKGHRLVELEILNQFECMTIGSEIEDLVQHRKNQIKDETNVLSPVINNKKAIELEIKSGYISRTVFARRVKNLMGIRRSRTTRDEIYHYDIDIYRIQNNSEKKRLRRSKKKRIVKTIINTHDIFKDMDITFDGARNLYTNKPLSIKTEETFNVASNNGILFIKIKPTNKKKFNYTFVSEFSVYNLHPKFIK